MPKADHVQVSTTVSSAESAAELARSAVRARLAACGQVVGPVSSVYWWQGSIDTATEWLVLLKTTGERCQDLLEHVRAHHSYEVPEIIVTPITGGNPAYLTWLGQETRST